MMIQRLRIALLVFCAFAAGAQAAERVVHRAGTDDATTLDPHKVGYPGETTIMSDLFVGLTALDAEAKAIPGCAQSWTISPDGRSYRFTLRPNLRWSDGTPLTATDFEYSLRRALAPATAFPYAARLFAIRNARAVASGKAEPSTLGVRALDPRTVLVELENPAPFLPEVLASFAMPVPRAQVERFGQEWVRGANFVTNGPFTLEEWRPNAFIRLRRNPNFYDVASVGADAVVHFPVPQAMTALRRYQAGEFDFVLSVPPDQVQWARREFGAQLRVSAGLGLEAIAFNTRKGPMQDARVRRALSMAIDRDTLARNVLGDGKLAADSYVAPGTGNYPSRAASGFAAWPLERRRQEARRLLAEVGYSAGKPLQFRLAFPANDTNRRIAVVIDAMWRSVGVKAELQAKEQRGLVADVARGDFDAVRVLWMAGYSDALAFLERLDGGSTGTTMNPSGYSNAGYDQLLAAAQREPDLGRRAGLLRQAEAIALEDQPVAPVYFFVGRRLVSPRLSGWKDNVRGIHLSRYMNVPAR
jgi:oligopeptide transport system substrate-binding protein